MKDRIIEEAVKVLQSEPEGMYCSQLMKRILENSPEMGGESFGFHLRNWKKQDASAQTPLLATHDETGFFKLAPAAPEPVETYSDLELAELLDVHPATLVQWKESGKIRERFITPEGRYIKPLIDPLIEAYRKAEPIHAEESLTEDERLRMGILYEDGVSVQEIARKFDCDTSVVVAVLRRFGFQADKPVDVPEEIPQSLEISASDKKYSRKKISFTAEDRARMSSLHEQGLSMTAIAEKFGCSLSTISRTLRQPGNIAIETEDAELPTPSTTVAPFTRPPERPNPIAFDEFVRQYWSVGTRAVDMLFLPQDVRSRILQAVCETLRYAYEKLNAAESTEEPTEESEAPALLQFTRLMETPAASTETATRQESPSYATDRRRGRPKGTGKYGCQTKAIRVPAHLVAEVADYARTHAQAESGSEGIAYRRTPK